MVLAFRVVECLDFSNQLPPMSNVTEAVLASLPHLVLFWIFSLIVFQGAGTYHFAMQTGGRGFDVVKPVFITVNLIVSGCIISLFVSLGLVDDPAKRTTIATAGSSIMFIIVFITSFSFLVYGILVTRSMGVGIKKSTERSASRFLVFSCIFSGVFLVESVMWLISALDTAILNGSETIITTIYLTSDCIALITIYVLFFPSVTSLAEKAKESSGRGLSDQEMSKKSRLDDSKSGGSSPKLFSHAERRAVLTRTQTSNGDIDVSGVRPPRSPSSHAAVPPSPPSHFDVNVIAPPSPRGPMSRPSWITTKVPVASGN